MDAPDWMISAEELIRLMKQSAESTDNASGLPMRLPMRLIDVRDPEEHQECCIDGSELIPLDELTSRAEKELRKDEEIILYCAHGIRSLQALMALRMQGFEKLRSLEGGIVAWQARVSESGQEQ